MDIITLNNQTKFANALNIIELHYIRVRPMASSNGVRFAMCSTHLAYVAEDSYVYIIPRTAEWITDFKNAIKNGT